MGISNFWLRRGVEAVPILVKQLATAPEKNVAAAYYLGELGAEAKAALPALKEAARDDNELVARMAKEAIEKISEDAGERQK
jgi:HEAT repeat protein